MAKFEIKSRWEGKILFSIETESLKLAVEAAVKSGADLSGADLSRADLSGADLSGADLSGADLSRANLSRADLSGADLYGADLSGADLSRANLSRANLSRANLYGADLYGADLYGADLSRADLSRANLSGADLSGADLSRADLYGSVGINKFLSTPLLILLDQLGEIRAYKLVKENGEGPFNGGIKYVMGETFSVQDPNKDEYKQCAEGINLATLDWCIRKWKEGYKILIAEFTASDIAAIPVATDGKFRVSKCKIVGEKNLAEIGLIKSKEKSNESNTGNYQNHG